MKAMNFLTLAIILLFGATSSMQAQCYTSFSYTNTGNSYNFTASTSAGLFNPVYEWTLYDYNDNSVNTITTTTPGVNHIFSGASSFGHHYACLTVLDSITGCQTFYCDSVYVNNGNPCNTTVSFLDSSSYMGGTNFYAVTNGFQGWASYYWDFGNGNVSYSQYPNANLANGWHNVCLTVTDSICTETFCDSVYVNNSNPCNTSVSFFDSSYVGGTDFYAVTSGFQGWASYYWDFGNGNVSYSQYPNTNLANGWHNVCLTVTDSTCTETFCDSVYVNNSNPCNTSVSFFDSVYTTGGTDFYAVTSGFQAWTSYYWDFGNGNVSNNQYPNTNLANGWHNVCLTVTDSICTETFCDSVYINNGTNPCNTSVSFFDSVHTGGVAFYPVTSGFLSGWNTYFWDFGNGNVSNNQYPNTNLANGWHNVCLTVTDSICTETYCDSVYINNGSPCVQNAVTLNLLFDNYATETSWTVTDANGTIVANGGNYPAFFNGQNLPIDLCLPAGCYNFNIYDSYGDGICCLYGNGSYSLVDNATGASLVSGGSFTSSETTNFCVGGSSNPCGNFGNGSFTYSVGANGVVTFTPVLTSNQYPLNFAWDFGNGNVSSNSSPTFTFTNGYHVVCLTADSASCVFTYCDTIMVTTNNGNPTGPCANLTTDINITQSINDPFLLWMQPVVNGAASNAGFTFVWDFGDNTGAMSGAPLHTYNSFGSYVVCLMALDTMNGCVSTFCDTITVDSSGNFSRSATKPGFTVNILPPVINYFMAVDKVEEGKLAISLFPNPANNVVNLAINTEVAINGTVSILDLTGKVAYTNTLNVVAGQEQVSLPIEQLPSGMYLVRITSETTQQTMKFIKE
jgi:PKD repeat protein